MTEEPRPAKEDANTIPYVRQRQHCFDHARDLIASAERLLPEDGVSAPPREAVPGPRDIAPETR